MTPEPKKVPQGKPQGRQPWTPPTVSDLPRLTELTLQTGIPGGGGTEGSGSTVIA